MDFQRGKSFLSRNDFEAAQFYFDKVIDSLMNSEAHHPGSQLENTKFLNDYLQQISTLELAYLKKHASANIEQGDALLEEAIEIPLYLQPDLFTLGTDVSENAAASSPSPEVPITINKKVLSFLKAFRTVRRQNIQNALNRSDQYIDTFKQIFRDYQIPEDLAYLPIIESGFRVGALSRARAMGVWQFMAGTARMFGLRVDWVVDERRDPFKAAAAAARYLKVLYNKYGDWYLALACYNGGTRRVSRGIRRLKTKDFFKIARSRYIRRETRNYVPAYLASLLIAKTPEQYGFVIEPQKSIFGDTKVVQTPSPVSLKDMAAVTGVPYETLKQINPQLLQDFTPFNQKYYSIRLPKDTDESALENLKKLPPEKKLFTGWYRVRRGDSLYSIARKFRTSVHRIKQTNKLRSNLIRPGKRLLIPRGF